MDRKDFAEKLATEGSPSQISNALMAKTTLGERAKILAFRVNTEVVAEKIVMDGTAEDISTIFKAISTIFKAMNKYMGYIPNVLARFIDNEIIAKKITRNGSPQVITNMMTEMIAAVHNAMILARAVDSKEVAQKFKREGTPDNLVCALLALKTMGHETKFLDGLLDSEEMKMMKAGAQQDFENPMLAKSKLRRQAKLLERLIEK